MILGSSGLPELLRRSRGRGRRLRLVFRAWGHFVLRLLRFLRFLHMMVAIVLRFGFVGLRGFGLRLIWSLRRCGGGLRGFLCHDRQRHCKHDERSCNNST